MMMGHQAEKHEDVYIARGLCRCSAYAFPDIIGEYGGGEEDRWDSIGPNLSPPGEPIGGLMSSVDANAVTQLAAAPPPLLPWDRGRGIPAL